MATFREHTSFVACTVAGVLAWAGAVAAQGWTRLADMPAARSALGAVAVRGYVVAVGGHGTDGTAVATTTIYDPGKNTWGPTGAMTYPHDSLAVVAIGDAIYAIGGRDDRGVLIPLAEVFDLGRETWTVISEDPAAARTSMAVATDGTLIYTAGGNEGKETVTTRFAIFDPARSAWAAGPPMTVPRRDAAAAFVSGKVCVIGGFDGRGALGSVEVYDVKAERWATGRDMPTPRYGHAATVINGKIYVMGGNPELATVEVYDPAADRWTAGPSLPSGREFLGAATVAAAEKIYAVGGTYKGAPTPLLHSLTLQSFALALPASAFSFLGDSVVITVKATGTGILSADLRFAAKSAVVTNHRIVRHAFDPGASVGIARVADSIVVSMMSGTGIDLSNQSLIDVAFDVRTGIPDQTMPLTWVAAGSFLNEVQTTLTNGQLRVIQRRHGDITLDGFITSVDASWILQHRVGTRPTIETDLADVSANGAVTSYDGALILYRVLDTLYVFPADGGSLPKPAPVQPRTLTLGRDGSTWVVRADDATGIVAGEMTIALPMSSPTSVVGDGMIAFRQDGSTLRVAFARLDSGEPVLLRLEGMSSTAALHILRAELNEGQIPVAATERPVALSLTQNAPNPFNPSTTIRYAIPASGSARLVVYDLGGRVVRALLDGTAEPGVYEAVWDGRDAVGREVASGVYLCRLTVGQESVVRRMILVR